MIVDLRISAIAWGLVTAAMISACTQTGQSAGGWATVGREIGLAYSMRIESVAKLETGVIRFEISFLNESSVPICFPPNPRIGTEVRFIDLNSKSVIDGRAPEGIPLLPPFDEDEVHNFEYGSPIVVKPGQQITWFTSRTGLNSPYLVDERHGYIEDLPEDGNIGVSAFSIVVNCNFENLNAARDSNEIARVQSSIEHIPDAETVLVETSR